MSDVRIGVVGGSGLYQMEGLVVREERRIETPFGDPSDVYILGELDGLEKKLRKFKPVTKQKFFHPGLVTYRDGMIELVIAERIKYGSAVVT